MTTEFALDVEWLPSDTGPDELKHTACHLRIDAGGRLVTRVEDDWSKSVNRRVRVSAYPLALWIAGSWWRLMVEPAPSGRRSHGWRMSHEMAAVGYGYLWPRLTFEPDGEAIDILCQATEPLETEPVRFLSGFRSRVDRHTVTAALRDFVNLVVTRLGDRGVGETALQRLWSEVEEEFGSDELREFREMEARLGFDPDGAPDAAVRSFIARASEVGTAAIAEIAPVCLGADPSATLEMVDALAGSDDIRTGKVDIRLQAALAKSLPTNDPPWARGWNLARLVRKSLELGSGELSDMNLARILSVECAALTEQLQSEAPLGLAIRNGSLGHIGMCFRKKHRLGRRFEAARFLADFLLAPPSDRWLPATDMKTFRQKQQRAFAAEFLCPFDELMKRLGGNTSDEAIEEVSEDFGVAALAVRSQLVNHGALSSGVLTA